MLNVILLSSSTKTVFANRSEFFIAASCRQTKLRVSKQSKPSSTTQQTRLDERPRRFPE
jgi:hypothetical protein